MAGAKPDDSIAIVRERLAQSLIEKPPDAAAVRRLVDSLQAEGSWREVDYHSTQPNRWTTADHLRRVMDMARAYGAPGQPLANDPALAGAIRRAFDYWLDHDFQSGNWWYNEIDVPRTAGQILLLMGPEIAPGKRDQAIRVILSRSRIGMTGQNQVWLSENVLVRGLLTHDDALVRQALDTILGQIRVTTEEGIQPDYSFHQHGPQQQFGNYGLSFADEETRWAALVRGTDFALSPRQVEVLRGYLLQGLRWVVWRDRMDISGLGRQLYPGSQRGKARGVASAFRTMETLDPAMAGEYEKLLAPFSADPPSANALTGDRAFWRSDMIVHRTPAFYASVRMCSTRVASTESINGENLQGGHLGDGATYLYRRGDEYEDIFPVWDWHRLPGVTAYTEGPMTWFDRKREGSDFVGEVSDGRYGAAAMELRRDGLTGRKAWFFFDNGFVCLGAGIRADQDRAVATTLNQCRLNGEVRVNAGGQTTALPPGTRQQLDHPRWVYHDGTGYLFLQPAEATVSNQEQSGTWKSVIATEPADPVTRRVFSLSIEHGRQPRGASYAYLILPGVDPERLAADVRRPAIHVISNTAALQVVRNDAPKLTQAVFYQPGQVDLGDRRTLAVDRPCLLMAERSESGLKLSLADPTQQLDRIRIELSGHFTGEECRYDPAAGKSIVTFGLPSGGDAGKSVNRSLRFEGKRR